MLTMTDTQFNQSAWFERIGYSGPTAPTLETLNRLILAHSHSISYETLDIMLGRPPKLDVASLQSKMIARKRGGYCFESRTCSFGPAFGRWAIGSQAFKVVLSEGLKSMHRVLLFTCCCRWSCLKGSI